MREHKFKGRTLRVPEHFGTGACPIPEPKVSKSLQSAPRSESFRQEMEYYRMFANYFAGDTGWINDSKGSVLQVAFETERAKFRPFGTDGKRDRQAEREYAKSNVVAVVHPREHQHELAETFFVKMAYCQEETRAEFQLGGSRILMMFRLPRKMVEPWLIDAPRTGN